MFEQIGELFRTATPWISAGMNLLSTVKAFEAAGDVERVGAFNRKVFEDEAAAVWRSYEDRATILTNEQRQFYAEQRAAYAKSGVEIQGSAVEVLKDIVYRQELDQVALRNEAVAERLSRLNKGAVAEWQAQQEGSGIRARALSNFAASLLDPATPSLWQSSLPPPEQAAPQPTVGPARRGWRPVLQ